MSARSRHLRLAAAALVATLALAGCVTVPTAPAVMVLPGQYKPFDQFRTPSTGWPPGSVRTT